MKKLEVGMRWLRKQFHRCMAHEQVSADSPVYGVLDVTFRCKCGRTWDRTLRTYDVRVADHFYGMAMASKRRARG